MSAQPTILFKEILNSGTTLRVKVTGRSMQPFLYSGDIVTVVPVLPHALRIGNLIFFQGTCDKLLLHRIVRRMRRHETVVFQTKGDACRTLDAPVSPEHIWGKVCEIERIHPTTGAKQIVNLEAPRQRTLNSLLARIHFLKIAAIVIRRKVRKKFPRSTTG